MGPLFLLRQILIALKFKQTGFRIRLLNDAGPDPVGFRGSIQIQIQILFRIQKGKFLFQKSKKSSTKITLRILQKLRTNHFYLQGEKKLYLLFQLRFHFRSWFYFCGFFLLESRSVSSMGIRILVASPNANPDLIKPLSQRQQHNNLQEQSAAKTCHLAIIIYLFVHAGGREEAGVHQHQNGGQLVQASG